VKKILSVFVLLCILCVNVVLPSYAIDDADTNDSSQTPKENETLSDVLTYTCIYDVEEKRVRLSGSIDNRLFGKYGDCTLCVYAVPVGVTEQEVAADPEAKPLAETAASIKFEFSFKADKIKYRYSRYAIFFRSPDGLMTLAANAQYPEVEAVSEEQSGIRNYKGLATQFSSFATESDAGTLILPVYFEELFSQNSSNTFILAEGKQYFFNSSVIDGLDVAINSASVAGTKVYLRFLYRETNTELGTVVEHSVPHLDKEDELIRIHAAVSFLTERYSQPEKNKISGFVLGDFWNEPRKISDTESLKRYVMLCGEYAVVVANAARTVNNSIDIVIPFDGSDFAENTEEEPQNPSKMLFEKVFEYLDNGFNRGLKCSLLVYSSHTPLGITELTKNTLIDVAIQGNTGKFCAGEQKSFSSYLNEISHRYESCPQNYIFEWMPAPVLRDNALSTAYVYSYYSLLLDPAVTAFVIRSSPNGADLRDIGHMIKFIDTHEGADETKDIPRFFGKKAWSEILGTTSDTNLSVKHYFNSEPRLNTKEKFLGEFGYFDPSATGMLVDWQEGNNCLGIKLENTQEGERLLRSDLLMEDQEYAETMYVFEYSENMIYTQNIKLRFDIVGAEENALYELKLILGSSKNKLESSCIVSGNSINEMIVDISKCATVNMIDFIRISVRSLDGKSDTCSLLLYELCGLSNEYDSEELKNLVHAEREKIRDTGDDEEEKNSFAQILLAMGIVMVTAVLGVAIFLSFRKEDKNTDTKDK